MDNVLKAEKLNPPSAKRCETFSSYGKITIKKKCIYVFSFNGKVRKKVVVYSLEKEKVLWILLI